MKIKLYYFQLGRESSSFDRIAELETKVTLSFRKKGNLKKIYILNLNQKQCNFENYAQ